MISTLIADDSRAELDVILYIINKFELPLCPATADNGEEALLYLTSHPVDLLITDIRMPFLDGLELSRKALEINPKMKIIISSGYSDFTYAKTAISLGVEEYLLKPLQPEEFVNIVQKICQQIDQEKNRVQTDELQIIYSRNQITQEILRGVLRPESDGFFSQEIHQIMPQYGLLTLLCISADPAVRMHIPEVEVRQIRKLTDHIFDHSPRLILWDDHLILIFDSGDAADENTLSEQIKLQMDSFISSMQNIYGLQIFSETTLMPTPETLKNTVHILAEKLETAKKKAAAKSNFENESDNYLSNKIVYIRDYISEHYQEDLNLDSLAKLIYVHPDYLSRMFKKETGTPLNHYIKAVRMNQACRLLETTHQKVTSISSQVGYQNCAYFIRSFTNHFGISPEKYRQQYQERQKGKIQ